MRGRCEFAMVQRVQHGPQSATYLFLSGPKLEYFEVLCNSIISYRECVEYTVYMPLRTCIHSRIPCIAKDIRFLIICCICEKDQWRFYALAPTCRQCHVNFVPTIYSSSHKIDITYNIEEK